MPVRRRCARIVCLPCNAPMPSTAMAPAVGRTRPLSVRSSVDLPAPEEPSRTVKRPFSIDSVVGASARVPVG